MNRFLTHTELLQEYFRSRAIAFGSQADLLCFAEQIGGAYTVQEELASILRSVLYAENLALGRTELLEVLCTSLNGGSSDQEAHEFHASGRELILFVNRIMRSVQTGTFDRTGEASLPTPPPGSFLHTSRQPLSGQQESAAGPYAGHAIVESPAETTESTPAEHYGKPDGHVSRKTLAAAIWEATERESLDGVTPQRGALAEAPAAPEQGGTETATPPAEIHAPATTGPPPVPASRQSILVRPAVLCSCAALAGFALGALLPRRGIPSPPADRRAHVAQPMPSSKPSTPLLAASPASPAQASQSAAPSTVPPVSARSPACTAFSEGATGGDVHSPSTRLTTPLLGQPIYEISGATACSLVVADPAPVYPALASLTKLEGAVSLEIVISPQGTVTVGHVLDGPALLRGAAEQAVRQWRFRPYLQDGHAVEAETRVQVSFKP